MQALEQNLTSRQRNKIDRIWSRKQIEQAFIETFELVGGVPRLALWAAQEENYGEFLKLLMRLAPKEAMADMGHVIEYRSNVPQSPLSRRIQQPQTIEEGVILDGQEEKGEG